MQNRKDTSFRVPSQPGMLMENGKAQSLLAVAFLPESDQLLVCSEWAVNTLHLIK